VKRSFGAKKVMVSLFWSVDGIRVLNILESDSTMNSEYFTQHIIAPLAESEQRLKAKKQKQKFVMHMDNAPIHKSAKTQHHIQDKGLVTAPHPAYSPDLAPSDFFLFGRLKTHPGSLRFETPDEIETWISGKFDEFKPGELQAVFNEWERRLEWVIHNKGV
jgi:histone-lysine N-methyltransferase SETMAR